MRACRALSTATATSPASRALALAISGHLADPAGRSPHAGRAARWRLSSGLPAFRAAVSLYTTGTTGSGGSESHPFLQRRACAAGQHSQRRELQTAQKPRARWRAVVGRQLGGKGVAYRIHGGGRRPISSGAAASCARAHPAPASAGMPGWGSGGPPQRWLAKGSAAAGKTRRAEGAMGVRSIATDFVDNAQELPEQRRCHHRGPLRALCARENRGSKTSHSYKHRLLG